MSENSRSHMLKRSIFMNGKTLRMPGDSNLYSHAERVKKELKQLGVSSYGLWRAEGRYLPQLVHQEEHVKGVVYGHDDSGRVMLAATDRRIIFLAKKPFFVNEDEITYDVVSGVSYSHTGIGGSITLHTRVKDYKIRIFNKRCAEQFVRYIEWRCIEHQPKDRSHAEVKMRQDLYT